MVLLRAPVLVHASAATPHRSRSPPVHSVASDKRCEPSTQALERLEKDSTPVDPATVNGKWELVFSSAINNVPLLNGYMPVREIITIDQVGLCAHAAGPLLVVDAERAPWGCRARTLTVQGPGGGCLSVE